MKQWQCFVVGVLLIGFIRFQGFAQADVGTLWIQNAHIVGDELIMDIYLRNDDNNNPMYLTDCSIYIQFDHTKWTSPVATFNLNTNLFNSNYSADAAIVNTSPKKTVGIEIFFNVSPSTANTITITNAASGDKLGTLTISGITDYTGTAGLAWGTGLYTTVIYAWWNIDYQVNTTLLTPPNVSMGPEFDVIVKNQELLNNEYTFDIYIRQTDTDGPTFYIDDCDFVLTYDNTHFNSPTISLVQAGTSKLQTYYTYNTQLSGNQIQIALSAPSTANQTEFDTKMESASSSGDGTWIGRFKITGATSGTVVTDVNPQWVSSGTPSSLFYFRPNVSPWNTSVDVTGNANYIVEPPQFIVQVTYPNGGESFCPGASTTITWSSQNIANVKITLLQGGTTVATLTNSTPAPAGSFVWNISNSLSAGTNYRIRIEDVSTPGRFDDSDGDFSILQTTQITAGPQDQTVLQGQSTTFTVTAVGSNLSYQWQFSTNGTTFTDISGATNASYTVSNAQPSDAGYYRVLVSGDCGTVSSTAQLTVTPITLTVNVTAYFQGLWNGSVHTPVPVAVELRSGSQLSTSTLVDRVAVMHSTTAVATAEFTGVSAGDYWVVIRCGGYLPIGSSTRISMSPGNTYNVDFTDPANVFNGNAALAQSGSTWYVRTGDLNGDRNVNVSDILIWLGNNGQNNPGQVPAP